MGGYAAPTNLLQVARRRPRPDQGANPAHLRDFHEKYSVRSYSVKPLGKICNFWVSARARLLPMPCPPGWVSGWYAPQIGPPWAVPCDIWVEVISRAPIFDIWGSADLRTGTPSHCAAVGAPVSQNAHRRQRPSFARGSRNCSRFWRYRAFARAPRAQTGLPFV